MSNHAFAPGRHSPIRQLTFRNRSLRSRHPRQTVFRGDGDHLLFLEKLAAFADLFSVDIPACCLMPNHFHLYVRVSQGNLSRFMQSFLTSFTVVINRRRKSNGHLFQGRFKAELVEAERYGNEVSRYLHLNQVRTATVRSLPATEKRPVLEEYPSSPESRKPCRSGSGADRNRRRDLCRPGEAEMVSSGDRGQ